MPVLTLDTETTSPDPETARIVTIALALVGDDGQVQRSQEWLVRPIGFEIPLEATGIHGISTEHAIQHGRSLDEVLGQVLEVLESEWSAGVPLVVFNAPYDTTLLDRELRRVSDDIVSLEIRGPVLDPYVLDKQLVPRRRGKGSRRLLALCEAYRVPLDASEAHGALADAVAAARLALKQLQYDLLREIPLEVIHEAEIAWKREQSAELRDYFTGIGIDEHVNDEWPIVRAGVPE